MLGSISLVSGIASWVMILLSVLVPGAIPNVGLAGILLAMIAVLTGAIAMFRSRHALMGFFVGLAHLLLITMVMILMALTGS